ncbi:NB-ARC domain-containing protein [Candidatus Cyanaurora vandensis]|uniref:NB-ARC domain-containing protein n=1 Tax=Candidatus Cyanaurora vandensis TaxID=2714958 RepID=UPI00257E953A|nr:NB-ARC domain-containing protein [Candidatus Cyanaurora vandensis]
MAEFNQPEQKVGTQYNADTINNYGVTSPVIPLQLPARVEHFTGRETEIEQVIQGLTSEGIVTLWGPGGIGKTAILWKALGQLLPEHGPPPAFPGGVILHNFYVSPQAQSVLESIALALGEEAKPTPEAAARRALGKSKRVLLLLEGVENVDDLDLVREVAGGSGLILATRDLRQVHGALVEVEPLPANEARELLLAWAGSRAQDQAAVDRVCTLVGGLPLALSLAGRYLREAFQTVGEYLAWLQESGLEALDFGQRQAQSVPLMLHKSLGRVGDAERRAFAVVGRLALDSFDHRAVAAALGLEEGTVGRQLGVLVRYGLLEREEKTQRYTVTHALVHTFARTQSEPELQSEKGW